MGYISVGIGGALGAIIRYALGTISLKMDFPLVTFLINLVGAVLIGFFVGIMMTRKDIPENAVLFLKVGFCGGFTTFSTFSLEVLNLIESNHIFTGIIYGMASVITCVIGVWIGRKIAMI
ncbi:MAG: fluoride efflux transporter CrcB [Eubacteriales bacterium]|jgi:CrcB protein|nr:fluoride efflux transporter CrcB [Eubacteriales bacterium]